VHGNSLDDDELKLIAESGGTASVTPATEAQMRVGAASPSASASTRSPHCPATCSP
jgi:cytosine/adenosine deaminase-related metal-dependent hydrolase